jgi:hypothetical protein
MIAINQFCRKVPLFKTNTPNTLTVQIPYGTPVAASGSAPVTTQQSLPNLVSNSPSSEAASSPSLAELSSRGCGSNISYPPLSPKSSLRRSKAVVQQQSTLGTSNKNLIQKSQRNLTGSDGITIPVITGVPTNDEACEEDEDALQPEEKAIEDCKPRSKGRTERGADARRYHTAGAIEDIKKQDGKDTSIQKRLSWNYGQHIPNNELSLQQQRVASGPVGAGRNGSNKCLSSDSMHSSSGVSSTGSLHLSIGSEWEPESSASTGTVVTATHIYRNLSNNKEQEMSKGTIS